MLISFEVVIEVPDNDDYTDAQIADQEAAYDTLLSNLEEMFGKLSIETYNSEWNYQ